MNHKTGILFIIVSFLFINCKNEKREPQNIPITNSKLDTIQEKKQIAKVIDEDFQTFLKEFTQDSIFQISRVNFPLKIKEANYENASGFEEKNISKSEYTKLDFTYPKDAATRELDAYSQKYVLKNNLMIVQIRGIDNGLYSDFVFEKKNGKWFLKTWTDQTT